MTDADAETDADDADGVPPESDGDARSEKKTKPDDQGPVRIDEELARHVENKREELLEKFEIPDGFPPEVMEEAEQRTDDVGSEIQSEADERRDLRDLTTWTVDPVDAQDFDDAISIRREGDDYRLWVHIADVTHYVHPDSAMWASAVERANTVYLPGYTVHMLPPVLAETVCSIVPNEDRLAHTVEMELDGETLSYETIDIYKSVVRSDSRLTYTECEHLLDEPETADEYLEDPDVDLGERVDLAWELADRMHEQRKEDGSLVLNPRRDRAHTIVEECMLKANKAVTHELMWDRGVEAMYRVHPQPSPDEWGEALQEIQELDGVSIPAETWDEPRKAVNATLESAPERQLSDIQWAVMKVMPAAKYMNDPFGGHHALNFEIYGHFTSPIRRLSDLINHWIVHTNDVPEDLVALCDRASDKERDAEQCEREYRQFLQEVGLDADAVNNRGIEVVDDPADADYTL
ncbi:ribonuclease R [Salinarchaeum sp. Harcht-Bsk1]|uniref:RNB domain-containing ribonuclease n=1 Tax=Salinarchaeum sp. Harcht-Bsk1 TaxID=1333523 RepID=UPI0003422BAC|nr:ribonuclease R family protein [Salinarchaeum sp. Harcht-Bsk1]AGN00130.1 ribonuclease R [Salinarchaeum sp. Harcht-Bsk1]